MGHDVVLLAKERSENPYGKTISWPDSNPSDPWKSSRQISEIAQKEKVDIVHNFGQTKWLFHVCRRKIPNCMSYGVLPQKRVGLFFLFLRKKPILCGCSNYITDKGQRLVGGKWRTIFNCVDLNQFSFVEKVPEEAPLVYLSRLDKIKGADIAIKCAIQANKKLILAGNVAPSGENKKFWKRHIEPFISHPNIQFLGPLDDFKKNQILGQAKALLVPIQWDEPFGMVFAEALACGTPVISCPRGALPEIITHGEHGFLCKNNQEICAAIQNVYTINRKKCRQRAESSFGIAAIAAKYVKVYEECLDDKAKH